MEVPDKLRKMMVFHESPKHATTPDCRSFHAPTFNLGIVALCEVEEGLGSPLGSLEQALSTGVLSDTGEHLLVAGCEALQGLALAGGRRDGPIGGRILRISLVFLVEVPQFGHFLLQRADVLHMSIKTCLTVHEGLTSGMCMRHGARMDKWHWDTTTKDGWLRVSVLSCACPIYTSPDIRAHSFNHFALRVLLNHEKNKLNL